MKTNNEKVFELLEQTELNWTVEKERLLRQNGDDTQTFGLFRSDDGGQLHTGVKEGYSVYQNSAMMHDFVDIVGDYLSLDNISSVKGGTLQGGRKVFVSFPIAEVGIQAKNSDTLKRYITFLNSHDGTSSVCIGSSNMVVSCSNSFYAIARSKSMERVRHTVNMNHYISDLKANMNVVIEQEKLLVEAMQSLVHKRVSEHEIHHLPAKLLGVNMIGGIADPDNNSTRKMNQYNKLMDCVDSEMEQKGRDAWGLFNGITYYTNHEQSKDGARNIILGSGSRINSFAFNYLTNNL